jgi:hypothetical protein
MLNPLRAGLGLLSTLSLTLLLSGSGCVRQPDVTTAQLPLKRVVIYRNGVAYFERAGEVEADRVTFKMRPRMVGDFLATLAVMQKGGSAVSSASFPIEVEEEEEENPEAVAFAEALAQAGKKPPSKRGLKEVVLRLERGRHDLRVGYIASTPLWKPSYRLVLEENGKAMLQAWGIIQNLSGEDWKDVKLALVAGAPIAFESTLGTPVTPNRPVVTDTGEVIDAVPTSMTTFRDEAPPAAASGGESMEEADDLGSSKEARKAMPSRATSISAGSPGAPPPSPKASMPMQAPMELSAPRDLRALAQITAQTGATRYEVGGTVTVPDESATMVLLLSQAVPGEAVFLFSPDAGVGDSSVHPFRVVRFVNASRGLLEAGPIAVFEKGAFLGQGLMGSLSPESKATVPFALQRSLTVYPNVNFTQEGARISKIEAGRLFIERDQVKLTTYEIKNGGAERAKLLVRHPRDPGWRLHKPPAGTEERATDGHALVPTEVARHSTSKLLVDERFASEQQLDWTDPLADVAVEAFLSDAKSDAAVVAKLKDAWKVRSELRRALDRQSQLVGTQRELEKAARETRLSLEAIEKNTQAADLRATLTSRLREQTAELERATKELIEVKLKLAELEVRLRDAVRSISVRVPRGER